ncbi:MAG: PP2C family protein-serine/threonine phosphatase [Planctomycetota bacterium]
MRRSDHRALERRYAGSTLQAMSSGKPLLTTTQGRGTSAFFKQLSPRGWLWISLGVFFLFAPMWSILSASIVVDNQYPGYITWCFFGGIVSVLYFLGFSRNRVYIVYAVLATAAMGFGGFKAAEHAAETGSWFGPGTNPPIPTLEGFGIVLSLVVGYELLNRFTAVVGKDHVRSIATLDVARGMHESLVPPISVTTGDGVEIAATSVSSEEMGGDLADAILAHDSTYLLIADVSGHGVRAGVVMSFFKGALRTALDHEHSPAKILAAVNRVLYDNTDDGIFVTATLLRIRRSDGGWDATQCNAGHPPTLIVRGGKAERGNGGGGLPLGITPAANYEDHPLDARSGDALALYSDGLTEARQPESGTMLGIDGLRRLLAANAALGTQELLARSLAWMDAETLTDDDKTLVVARLS